MFERLILVLALPALVATVARAQDAASQPSRPLTGLFVGNSYCDFHVIPGQVAAMVRHTGRAAACKRQTKGGYSLEKHWADGVAQERIAAEPWDFVVLQNHSRSALDAREGFDEYGKRFIDAAKAAKVRPILYLTWARQNLPADQPAITAAYCKLAIENGVAVAPVGVAFANWLKVHPDVSLHAEDRSHPSMAGAYLSACVLYATITGQSPIGQVHRIEGYNWVTKGDMLVDLEPALARALQQTAWETVRDFDPAKHLTVPEPPATNPADQPQGR